MSNFKQHKRSIQQYVMIPIDLSKDTSLSVKEFGMIVKLLMLPPDWEFSVIGLSKIMNDSKDGVASTLKKIEDKRYLLRERKRNEKGHLKETIYHIFEYPYTEEEMQEVLGIEPKTEIPVLDKTSTSKKPKPEKPELENQHNIIITKSNNYLITNTNVLDKRNNKKTKKSATFTKTELEIIRLFELAKEKKATKAELNQIKELTKTYKSSVVKQAAKRLTKEKANFNYMNAVLSDWYENGVKDVKTLRELLKQRRELAKQNKANEVKLSKEAKAMAENKKSNSINTPAVDPSFYYDWMNEE